MRFILLSFLAFFSIHCSQKLDLECGCVDSGRRQYIVQVRVGDKITDFLREVDFLAQTPNDEIDIYGMCFEHKTKTIFFCTESRSDYRALEESFRSLNFRDEEF